MSDFMSGPSVFAGLVLQEAPGEEIIMTHVDQIDVALSTSFAVKMFRKRGKEYLSLVRD